MSKHLLRSLLLGAAVVTTVMASASPASAAWTTRSSRGGASSHVTSGTAGTTGDPTQPQPASNADFSGNGANTHGAYDSTRDGSPSANGKRDGKATGEPCAGCVGRADNKNPNGQQPNGSDHNAGYECDTNKGIGQGNPAHTGCTTSTTTAPAAAPSPPA